MIQPVFRTDFSFFPSDTSICPSLTPQYVLQKLWFLPPICSSWSSHISVSKPVSLTRSFPSVHWKSSSTVRSFSPIQALSWPRPSTETPAQSESVTSLHSERLLYPHARPHPPLLFHSFWRFLFLSSPAYFSYHFICTWIACCDLFPPLLFTLPCMALWTNTSGLRWRPVFAAELWVLSILPDIIVQIPDARDINRGLLERFLVFGWMHVVCQCVFFLTKINLIFFEEYIQKTL